MTGRVQRPRAASRSALEALNNSAIWGRATSSRLSIRMWRMALPVPASKTRRIAQRRAAVEAEIHVCRVHRKVGIVLAHLLRTDAPADRALMRPNDLHHRGMQPAHSERIAAATSRPLSVVRSSARSQSSATRRAYRRIQAPGEPWSSEDSAMSEEGWKEFLGADGVDDWVVLHGGATAVFGSGRWARRPSWPWRSRRSRAGGERDAADGRRRPPHRAADP